MQIIWNPDLVEKIKNSQTVLELETFDVEGKNFTAYCIVPAEKLILEIASLENNQRLHEEFIKALHNKDYVLCQDIAVFLKGKFGGELDTFYEEVLSRLNTAI
jgi:hypothetical protein